MSHMMGGDQKKLARQQAAAQAAQNQQALRQQQMLSQQKEQATQTNLADLGKTPRGRRLLMGDSGGLGSTLGGG